VEASLCLCPCLHSITHHPSHTLLTHNTPHTTHTHHTHHTPHTTHFSGAPRRNLVSEGFQREEPGDSAANDGVADEREAEEGEGAGATAVLRGTVRKMVIISLVVSQSLCARFANCFAIAFSSLSAVLSLSHRVLFAFPSLYHLFLNAFVSLYHRFAIT
jgi:hypothetical protein